MRATQTSTQATRDRQAQLRLNLDLLDRLMKRRGAHTPRERADLLDIDRSTYYRWLEGRIPDLDKAMQAAGRLGTRVDKLWLRDVA